MNKIEYIFPDIKMLLVDDNEMNLMVAEELLKELEVKLDLAKNGSEAVTLVENNYYDVVFMDHMMPVMNGVEATRVIRSKDGEYFKNLPIIALSGNDSKEDQDLFINSGMNAFLCKPIDLIKISSLLISLFPEKKVEKYPSNELELTKEDAILNNKCGILNNENEMSYNAHELTEPIKSHINEMILNGIDAIEGIKNCGNNKLYLRVLNDFCKYADAKIACIMEYLSQENHTNYTIEVHAMKNVTRLLGNLELSDKFKHLEELSKAKDINAESLKKLTKEAINDLEEVKAILIGLFENNNAEKPKESSIEDIKHILQEIYDATDSFDLDRADLAIEELMKIKLPDFLMDKAKKLEEYVADVSMEETLILSKEMIDMI